MERADIAIIGTGPAGVSAAITAKVRGKTVLLFGSRELSSKLTKAHKIQNYPGLPDIDGAQLAHTLNNTCVAPPRMLIAFLENHLQADGTVTIPAVLQPYMGGKTVLVPKKK